MHFVSLSSLNKTVLFLLNNEWFQEYHSIKSNEIYLCLFICLPCQQVSHIFLWGLFVQVFTTSIPESLVEKVRAELGGPWTFVTENLLLYWKEHRYKPMQNAKYWRFRFHFGVLWNDWNTISLLFSQKIHVTNGTEEKSNLIERLGKQ